ncbi:PREDICTED: ral GTPase-activating protein subunit beta-like [Priapulus caudatus]|uniref:Ral GTPase-activating protein subunit beta-like n=1 Tax=Priapulus caudatus TaxID=37621 RepID=A0ABM1ESX2_PRICU|nr:PREDICTED: ral GTPase-activating protein subunit beta-like [Priapulus caudatus]
MLEQPLGNDQDPLPTVVVINRSPQGRHAWMMQLRQLSRKKSLQAGSRSFLVPPPRPQPKDDCGTHYTIKQSYFPESVDNIPQTRAEKSIPTLSSLVTEARAEEYARTESFVQQQVNFEAMVRNRAPKGVTAATDCQPPGVCHEFQTARLALSHLGFLSLEALKSSDNSPVPSLIALDSGADALHADVDALDTLRSRTSDTLFVFYVRSGQKNVDEILANATAGGKVDPHFYEVLHSMGWPVNVHQHPGWNGLLEERWLQQAESVSAVRGGHHHHHHHQQQQQQQQQQQEEGPYDAVRQILYWADHATELAIIAPSPRFLHCLKHADARPRDTEFPYVPLSNSTRTPADGTAVSARSALRLELDLEKQKTDKDRVERMSDSPTASPDLNASNSMRKKKHWSRQLSVVGHEMKVMLVWLESFEDNETFPASELMAELSSPEAARPCDKDTFLIFVHALQSGLFRVHLRGGTSSSGRISMATPLVDGMLVSRRTLGMLVRQTTVNMHRRRRLDSDMYQPPHVKRRLKIQEIALRYRSKLAGPEFYAALFDNVTHMQESIV